MNRVQALAKLKEWETANPTSHLYGYNVSFNVPEQVWECDSLDKTHRVSSFSLESLVNNFPYVIKRKP
jgi:hypothetical protein